MNDKASQLSISDLKKWGFFIVFLLALFIVLFLALKPEGEEQAILLTNQADQEHRQAKILAEKSQTPQDLANVDLAFEHLKKAKSLLVESDYGNAGEEARVSMLHSAKVVSRGTPKKDLTARIRLLEVSGDINIRKRFSSSYIPVDVTMGLDLGDTVKTIGNGSCRMAFTNKIDMVLGPQSEINFPDFQGSAPTDPVLDLLLEEGSLHLKSTEPGRKTSVRTRTGKVELFPNSEVWISYASTNGAFEIKVSAGRAEITSGTSTADLAKDQKITFMPGSTPGSPENLPAPPDLLAPDNFTEFPANQNGFALVPLRWVKSSSGKYHIEISGNSLFNSLSGERKNYTRTSFETDLRQGIYYWRVSSIAPGGTKGLPSIARQFEITGTNASSSSRHIDNTPPKIVLKKPLIQGYIVIIEGTTERDARVTVDGEKAILNDQTGKFTCALNFPGKGIYSINVIAIDLAENRETQTIRVEIRD